MASSLALTKRPNPLPVSKSSNFIDLNDDDKRVLNEQIDEMIRSKYNDINYNGLNENIMAELTNNGKKNPFDNSVVIIDEAHNFVSMIVNKMQQKKAISYKLYEYLKKYFLFFLHIKFQLN